ncbi:hypothetical protein QQX98_000594 [Neonectria punicea]|uniref:Uncharacterized protein n=1 Tax=Neonectria punicea TaxID=979145 RepID=A0ABR1HTE7_9HYPO
MSTDVEGCEALVSDVLPIMYGRGAHNASITATPSKVLEDFGKIAIVLYAQSLSESPVSVNFMMPGIRAFLKRLAGKGVGFSEDYNGVRYKFMENKSSGSATTAFSL